MTHPSSLNQQAVCQIQEGEYDDAISTLIRALKIAKLALSGEIAPTTLRNVLGKPLQ